MGPEGPLWRPGAARRGVTGRPRLRRAQTVMGSMLDPLADKILVGTLAAGTAYAGILSPWFLGVTGALAPRSAPTTRPVRPHRSVRAQWDATACCWAAVSGTGPRRGPKARSRAREREREPHVTPPFPRAARAQGPTSSTPGTRSRCGPRSCRRPTRRASWACWRWLSPTARGALWVPTRWFCYSAWPARAPCARTPRPGPTPSPSSCGGTRRGVVATTTVLSGAQYAAEYRRYMVLPPKSKQGGRERGQKEEK